MSIKRIFPSIEFVVSSDEDICRVRSEMSKFAGKIRLTEKELEELRIVITEISKNIIKHSSSGKLSISFGEDEEKGVYIVAENPTNNHNTTEIFDDGYSTANTLGIGLGAVKRLLTDVKVKVEDGKFILTGKKIFSEKKDNIIQTSVYSRPKPGFKSNGDAYFIKRYEDYAVVAVVDGIGHGDKASEASSIALKVIEDQFKDELEQVVLTIHRRLHGSRGCVIGIVRMSKEGKIEYLGVGNIRTQIYTPEMYKRLVSFDGLLGSNIRTLRTDHLTLSRPCLIVLHSDGVTSFNFEDKRIVYRPVMEVAKESFEKYKKSSDDATLLIARVP
ncbi:SpoIIE family protein phosphatase [candidate division WOR-3 bacterium]|nr:SpoIIE family protein phosphatase [candidate division WOR-3 bacterium]